MKLSRILTFSLLALFIVLATFMANAATDDADNDGLPDSWERGAGRQYGCQPGRQDLLVYAVMRTDLTEKVSETIQKATAFYAQMGIALHVVRGPRVADDNTSYEDLGARMLPRALQGKAHFHVFSSDPGGQTSGLTSISGVADIGWNSFVHEMGHQLLLEHEARGFKVQSPLHASLMSYQYETSIDGTPDVHYSDGTFAKLRMRESDLDETLPFSVAALHFLSASPYRFPLKATGPNSTQVDWNRNGVFGEQHVRADINYDDGTYLGDRTDLDRADTAPVVAYDGTDLWVAFGALPGRTLVLRKMLKGNKWGPSVATGLNPILGDPSFVVRDKMLWVAASTAQGVQVLALKPGGNGARVDDKLSMSLPRPPRAPTLAVLDGQLYLFLREANGRIQYARYSGRGNEWSTLKDAGLTSRTAVAVAWHPIRKEALLVTTADTPQAKFRLQVNYRALVDGGLGATGETEWIGGPSGGNASASRPSVLVDTSRDAGLSGRIIAFYQASGPGLPAFISMQVADKTLSGGWLERSAYDEWSITDAAPAAAFNPSTGDITYCYRDKGGNGMLKVAFNGTGIQDGEMGDFDEITFVHDHALRESLHP